MSDYTGNTMDLEVARYGLRTFRPVPASSVGKPTDLYAELTEALLALMALGAPVKPEPVELCPVYVNGSHWKDGTCTADCVKDKGDPMFGIGVLTLNQIRGFLGLPGALASEPEKHTAPHEDCGCGIYATLTLQHLVEQYSYHTDKIVAVIAAEGQTIIGDKGFRTQYARVVAYWCDNSLLDACQTQFKDAERYTNVNHMLERYGFPDRVPEPEQPTSRWRRITENLGFTKPIPPLPPNAIVFSGTVGLG